MQNLPMAKNTSKQSKKKTKQQLWTSIRANKALIFSAIFALSGVLYLLNTSALRVVVANDHLNIATFNILRADHDHAGLTWIQRADRAINVINGGTGTVPKLDIVGLQEVALGRNDTQLQYQYFSQKLSSLGYSGTTSGTNETNANGQNPIFWKTSRFTYLNQGKIVTQTNLYSWGTAYDNAHWVKLNDKVTKKDVFFVNAHLTAGTGNSAYVRESGARAIYEWVSTKSLPVILVGDMNSSFILREPDSLLNGDRQRMPYCIYTKNVKTRHALDKLKGRAGQCPVTTWTKENSIDNIYVSSAFRVIDYKVFEPGDSAYLDSISDHRPVYSRVTVN